MSLRIRSPQLREYLEEKLGQVSYSSDTGAYTIDGDLIVTGAITQAAGAVVVDTRYLGALTVGVDATGYDVKFYGDTTGYYWMWDEDGDTNGGMVLVGTATITGATAITGALTQTGNVAITGTLGVVGAVTVGVDDTGHDVKFYGAGSGYYWLWDENQDTNGGMTVVGTSQFTGTITVGVNDTGQDVKFYGATDGSYLYWDETNDLLELNGADLRLDDGDILQFGDAPDVQIRWDATDLDVLATADGSIIKFGNGTADFDIWIYGGSSTVVFDEGGAVATFDGYDIWLKDDDILEFGDGKDVTITWDPDVLEIDCAADDAVMYIGNGTNSFDIHVFGDTADDNIIFDASAKTLNFDGIDVQLEDADILSFGDADDIQMRWDGTDFDILAAADASIIKFGNGTNDFDIWIYAGSNTVVFNEGDSEVVFDGYDIQLNDGDFLNFGDLAAGDITMNFDGTNFEIEGAAAATSVLIGATGHLLNTTLTGTLTVGVNDTGHDVKLFGATDGAYFLWDESDDRIVLTKAGIDVGVTDYSIDFIGTPTTAFFKMLDDQTFASDSNEAILADISGTANAGFIKVVVGSATRYIALYAAKSA
jgi:hypothetical protein